MKKWYVNFYNNGVLISHCFEDDEKQAKHFASLVNGTVYRGQQPKRVEIPVMLGVVSRCLMMADCYQCSSEK